MLCSKITFRFTIINFLIQRMVLNIHSKLPDMVREYVFLDELTMQNS